MIYLVTANRELFENENYQIIGIDKSLSLLSDCKMLQFDTETTGIDAHLDRLLSMQFGNDEHDLRIVVDCSTVSPKVYKEILETKFLIGQNLKFDLQFLYSQGIIPRRIYDTMIVEQLLYLGYPSAAKSYSLQAIAKERLGIYIDKTVRGQIIWRGLDTETVVYGAGDVTHLEKIMHSQVEECKKKQCLTGAQLECNFTPAIAYLEWCGIKLDEDKWKEKIQKNETALDEAKRALDTWFIEESQKDNYKELKKFTHINYQGDLWEGFDLTPKCNVNWSSSMQVVKIARILGFDTKVQDKQTGKDKDSVLEKVLKVQKGICDDFLKLYFDYQEQSKVCSTYGQSYLDAINPKTGRIHSVFRALGAASGRMSCGSNQKNLALAKAKHIPLSRAINGVQLQNLPADEETRAAFVTEKNNLMVDCDYSALESRIGADVYNEQSMLDEFLHGSGDMHSLCAKMVFHEELKDIPIKDIKKLRPDLRKKVKSVEFN